MTLPSADIPYVIAALATLAAAGVFALRGHGALAGLLSVYFLIDGLHYLAHGAGALSSDPQVAQALLNTLHIPSYFGFIVGGLLVTSITGVHRRIWRNPLFLSALMLIPLALIVGELAVPSAYYEFSPAGPHTDPGPLEPFESAYALMHFCFDLYFVGVATLGLSRATNTSRVPTYALLLAVVIVREAPVVLEFLTLDTRWTFLGLFGLPAAPLLPRTLVTGIAVALAVSLVPLYAALRFQIREARHAATLTGALCGIITLTVALGSGGSVPEATLRAAFMTVLALYAAMRYGLFGTRRVGGGKLELPLAITGFSILMFLFVLTLHLRFDTWIAVPVGLGAALLAMALTVEISGVPGRTLLDPRDLADPPPRLQVGDRVDRYVVRGLLGEGSGSRAYLARDTRTGETVALKHAPSGTAAHSSREADALSRLRHPNIIGFRGAIDTPIGQVLVLDHVAGGPLSARLEKGPIPREAWVSLASGLLDGIAAVHDAGLVHRDIKPSNILLGTNGDVRIADFHIACVPDLEATQSTSATDAHPPGTLRYMSPAHARGDPPEARDDLYAAGATLYEAFAGHPYFEIRANETASELRARVIAARRPPISMGDAAWNAWFERALSPRTLSRFLSAREMRAAIPHGSRAEPSATPADGPRGLDREDDAAGMDA